MASSEAVDPLEWFIRCLEVALDSCRANPELRIGYGNLRHECSQWHRTDAEPTNIAIIYDTPGGSTTQLNVTYDPATRCFCYLDTWLEATMESPDPTQVLEMVHEHVRAIPEKREAQLQQQIRLWVGEGMSRSELFSQLNKLLQMEFLGGRITTKELQRGIQYALRHYAGKA